jgi:hypothetical protein
MFNNVKLVLVHLIVWAHSKVSLLIMIIKIEATLRNDKVILQIVFND